MKNPRLAFGRIFVGCGVSLMASLPASLTAATLTWSGGGEDSLWSSSANWGGATPVAADTLVFAGTTRTIASNDLAAGTVFGTSTTPVNNAITFSNTVADQNFTLTGNSFTMGGTIAAPTALGTVSNTIDCNIIMNGGRSFSLSTNQNLTVNGIISESGTGRALTKSGGTGVLTLTNQNTFSGSLQIASGTVSGNTIANAGTASAFGSGSLLRLGNAATSGVVLKYTGSAASTDRPVQIGVNSTTPSANDTGGAAIQNDGSGALVFTRAAFNTSNTGAIAPRVITLQGANTDANEVQGIISDNTASALIGVTKSGGGTWVLSGANTYSGVTGVTGGILRIGNPLALGSTTSHTSVSGGSLDLNGQQINGETIRLNGSGFSGGTLINTGGPASIATPVTISGNTTIGGTSGYTLSAGVTQSGGNFSLTKVGSNTVTISGTSDYTGLTKIEAGTLRFTSPSALPSTSILNSASTATSGSTLEMAASDNYTMAAASVSGIMNFRATGGAATITFTAASGNGISGPVVTRSFDSGANVTVVFNGAFETLGAAATADRYATITGNGRFIFNGSIEATPPAASPSLKGGLWKSGAGAVSFNASNTYNGTTTINGGSVKLGHPSALPGGIAETGGSSNLSFAATGGVIGLTQASGDFNRSVGIDPHQVQWLNDGKGGFAAYGGDRTANLGGQAAPLTWSGAGPFGGGGLILSAADADGTITLVNPFSLNNSNRTITVNDGLAAVDAVLSGAITQPPGSLASKLTKSGSGTLSLTGGNTYTGDTAITGGKLILNSAYLGDASTLSISSGAILELAYTGTDRVGVLSINGVNQPDGLYTSASHPLLISGSGQIQVGDLTPDGYTGWAIENGIQETFPEDDFDQDGNSNFLEYALGLDPKLASASSGILAGGKITFNKGIEASANGDVIYQIETSTTLGHWTVVETPDVNDAASISYTLPTGGQKQFVRLKVSQAP